MAIDFLQQPAPAFTSFGRSDKSPVVALPGGPCRGPEYLGTLAGLGDRHSIALLHPRGTPHTGGLSRGWWTDADDVAALADQLRVEQMDVVAHSAGTRLALATAIRYPHRVRSLLLITPPATWLTDTPTDADQLAAQRHEPEVADAWRSLHDDAPTTQDAYRASTLAQAPAGYAKWTAAEQEHAVVGAVSLTAAQAWFADIPADAAAQIRAASLPPTLVVAGDADLLTGVQPVREYASLLGADYALIKDCGHYPWVEQPEAFTAIASTWLARAI